MESEFATMSTIAEHDASVVTRPTSTPELSGLSTTAPVAHPFGDIFPLLPEPDLKALARDIQDHGLHEPIWLYEGQVLDGRNRLKACGLAKPAVRPTFREFRGTRQQALLFVWSMNFKRRHLNPSQAAVCVVEFDEVLEVLAAEAAAKQKRGKGPDGSGGRGKTKTLPPCGGKVSRSPTTAGQAAAMAGVSARTLERAKALKKSAPAKLEAVKAGAKSLSEAAREAKREQMRERVDLPAGKFSVVLGDPPYFYGNSGVINESDGYGRAARHYPPMTIAELCALDVVSRVADNAVLFLWVTSPLFAEVWPLITAWGFVYKTSMVWDKIKHNYGNYVSVRHELLLICTRGSCLPDHPTPMPDSVMSIPRSTSHSEKPEEFRALIDRLYDGGADEKLELFGRKLVPGWTVFGNELDDLRSVADQSTATNQACDYETVESSMGRDVG